MIKIFSNIMKELKKKNLFRYKKIQILPIINIFISLLINKINSKKITQLKKI